ncbi:hypothetical protein CRENBAI_022529 [Crenichthys baileyi]|uniref:Uncharacterized protein n=1 Tax=Crenichthys baileyi TaxID=28760 RepID=A0AAV9SGW5_9TELE
MPIFASGLTCIISQHSQFSQQLCHQDAYISELCRGCVKHSSSEWKQQKVSLFSKCSKVLQMSKLYSQFTVSHTSKTPSIHSVASQELKLQALMIAFFRLAFYYLLVSIAF